MIELLDFDITSTGSQQVPVSAEPQAIYFRSVCKTGTTPANHMYDTWGFWSRGSSGDRQVSHGQFLTDLSVFSNPHTITSTTHVLRMHDNSNNQLSVSVTGADASNLTIDAQGALATAGVRVMAMAISGLEDAWCGAYQYSAYPILFPTGFQPDFAFFSQGAGVPNDPVLTQTSVANVAFGVMNATNQASVNYFNSMGGGNMANAAQAASNVDLGYWWDNSTLLEQFYGEFQPTSFEIKGRSGQEITSPVMTQMVLCLKGTESTIETHTTPSGTIPHSFSHTPEALILAGSGNNLWNTSERIADTSAWAAAAQVFSLPGTPPTPISLNTSRGTSTYRLMYRNNMDGALWGILPGGEPTIFTNKYHGALTQFDGQVAETSWTLDGTGAPDGAYPFILTALGAKTGVTPGAGGFVPFGPGVFR